MVSRRNGGGNRGGRECRSPPPPTPKAQDTCLQLKIRRGMIKSVRRPRVPHSSYSPPETGCSGFSGPELARAADVIQSTRTPFKNAEATTAKANTVNRNPYNKGSFPR